MKLDREKRENIEEYLKRLFVVHREVANDSRPYVILEDFKRGGHPDYVLEKVLDMKHNVLLLKDLIKHIEKAIIESDRKRYVREDGELYYDF